MIQVQAAEGEQPSKRLRCQVVQRVMAKPKPLDVLQPLEEEEESDYSGITFTNMSSHFGKLIKVFTHNSEYLEGHVGDVNQLVVGEGQHVEEAQLCEGSRLDLLNTIMVQMQLFQ